MKASSPKMSIQYPYKYFATYPFILKTLLGPNLFSIQRISFSQKSKYITNNMNEKKGNKQCLFDTPRRVIVNIENDVRIRRPQHIYAKSRFCHDAAHSKLARKKFSVHKVTILSTIKFSASNFFMQLSNVPVM